MHRILPYSILFIVALLSQLLIFDNLGVSVVLSPLVYIIFIILLPIETSQLLMLTLGIVTGVVMDITMGVDGLNSISTIFVAFSRSSLLHMLFGKERIAHRGVPSEVNFGGSYYMRYLVLMVGVHHLMFFAFESLSIANLGYMIMRTISSSTITLLYVWLIARIFTNKKYLR